MYSSLQIAEYFIRKGIKDKRPMSLLKVMKMVYIAHGYFLATKGRPLIEEKIEAWKYGPVIPAIYGYYKSFKREPINKETYPGVGLLYYNEGRTTRFLDKVYDRYISFSASQLVRLTHEPGTPWSKTYSIGESGKVIPNSLIAQYYEDEMDVL
jgi:uncharacterized phage-associated protein